MSTISAQMMGLHGKMGDLERVFGRWPIAIGLATTAIGVGLVGVLDSSIVKTGKINDEILRLKNMGASVAEVALSPAFRRAAMNIATTYGIPADVVARLYGMPASMLGAEEAQLVLEAQAKWYRGESGGYYAMGSMGRGALENPHSRAVLNESLDKVLAGSNVTHNATDNSSGSLAAREKATGKFRHHLDVNGESFFSPGHAEPALQRQWERLNWVSETVKAMPGHEAAKAEKREAQRLADGEQVP